MQRVTLKAREV